MNTEDIEKMKIKIKEYQEIFEEIQKEIRRINTSSVFGIIGRDDIDSSELLTPKVNEVLKRSEIILRDIDTYDVSTVEINSAKIKENDNEIRQNLVDLKNNLITRYNRDIIKMEKRIADLKNKSSEYQSLINEINKLKLPEQNLVHIENYNTTVGSKELDYTLLGKIDKQIVEIEEKLNIKRNEQVEDFVSEIRILDNKIEELEHDFISLNHFDSRVSKKTVYNKIRYWNGKIGVLIAKLDEIKDKISEDDYHEYQSLIADSGIEFKNFKERLKNYNATLYADETKNVYSSLKDEISEMFKDLNALNKSILPFSEYGKIDGVAFKYIEGNINAFEGKYKEIGEIINQKHHEGILDDQLYNNLIKLLNIYQDKLNNLKKEVGIIEKENSDENEKEINYDVISSSIDELGKELLKLDEFVKKQDKIIKDQSIKDTINEQIENYRNKILKLEEDLEKISDKDEERATELKEKINGCRQKLSELSGVFKEKTPLEVTNKKSANKIFKNKFSKVGLIGLGLSLLTLTTEVGTVLIPSLLVFNALYAVKEPIMNAVNNILAKVIGAKKNENGEWISSNGVVINPVTSLLKSIAVNGLGVVPIVKKLVSGVKKISNMTPSADYINSMRQQRVIEIAKEYEKIKEEKDIEEFLNEKGITNPTREMFIEYIENINNEEELEKEERKK